jgi:hypothetical protein
MTTLGIDPDLPVCSVMPQLPRFFVPHYTEYTAQNLQVG